MTYPFRVVDCGGQGTQEWIDARLGIPSASNYSKLITTKGKRSASFDGYCMGLAAEVLTGKPYSWHKSELTITSASPYRPDTAIDPKLGRITAFSQTQTLYKWISVNILTLKQGAALTAL